MAHVAKRRTQADRRAAGRRALVEGTIEALSEMGFAATTSQEIVRRAECTTGAIQHHFGSKNGLYIAVLNQLLDEFVAALDEFPAPTEPLADRCEQTISTLVSLYTSPRYSAAFSLVLGAQHDADLRDLIAEQRRGSLKITRQAWRKVFADTGVPEDKLQSLLEIVVGVLRDFHFNKTVDAEEARAKIETNIALLKRMVLSELQAGR